MINPVKSWSYSAYSTYEQCPAKYKYEKIDKLPVPTPPAFKKGRIWHKKAEDFLKGALNTLPVELKNFSREMEEMREMEPFLEEKWGFTADWKKCDFKDWNNCRFRAVVDAGLLYEDNTLDIIDHKTGKKYGTNEDQVELFAMAGMFRYPTVKHVTARLWYLEMSGKDKEVIREFDAADKNKLRAKWERKVAPMFKDTRFAPRPNNRCGWCHFRNSNGGPCQYG